MILTDTHTHLYLNAFDDDRQETVQRAVEDGIHYMLLPNIDSKSVKPMLDLCALFPSNCFPMMGLHPTSVKENYREELKTIADLMEEQPFIAVGETGIDLYWDKTFFKEQEIVFRAQIELALAKDLPIVIHSRDSFGEIMDILKDYRNAGLRGVFHCFTGSVAEANQVIDMGLMLGIGGVVTFKNSSLDEVVENINLEHLLLETDAPFLAPVPFRGKRNESKYINLIAGKIADIRGLDKETIARITTENAERLFKIERYA